MSTVDENARLTPVDSQVDASYGVSPHIDTRDLSSALQMALKRCKYGEFNFIIDKTNVNSMQRTVEKYLSKRSKYNHKKVMSTYDADGKVRQTLESDKLIPRELMVGIVTEGMQAIASDSFWECFQSTRSRPWNWNILLFPAWLCGVFVRYLVFLPIRVVAFFSILLLQASVLLLTSALLPSCRLLVSVQRYIILVGFRVCLTFCFGGVIKVHGHIPRTHIGQIYVSNHSSVIDVVLMQSFKVFAIVGQLHPGILGFVEHKILKCLDPIWFNRTSTADRHHVADTIKNHVFDPSSKAPLLLFPEGVCVNNKYIVQFKRGAFDLSLTKDELRARGYLNKDGTCNTAVCDNPLIQHQIDVEKRDRVGVAVIPFAIKYSESISPHAYWNSRELSFGRYVMRMMSSWVLYADIYFMDGEVIRENEAAEDFAERVRLLIARKAGLIPRNWDGYLKYVQISDRLKRQRKNDLMWSMGFTDEEISMYNMSMQSHADAPAESHDDSILEHSTDPATDHMLSLTTEETPTQSEKKN